MEMKRKKKKGRPSKTPTPLKPSTNRRSIRPNPNFEDFNQSDDDDERKEKKVKLVVRLPQSDEKVAPRTRTYDQKDSPEYESISGSGSDSEPDYGEGGTNAKKRKINAVADGSDDFVSDQEKKLVKEMETSNGSPLESAVTTPLPEKKLLVFILQRLQKKDTRGAFSEPVDPDELPDYHEIIDQPMDFSTVNKKLDSGAYRNLEELEADVLLICSNAMKYNPSESIYYRQARSIQELAKRDFGNLRHEGDDGQPQPKVVRRGRPPGKNQKKVVEMPPPVDRVVPEVSSGATLANRESKTPGSNSYNLRKTPPLYNFRTADPFVSSFRSRNVENCSELSVNWNDEFPASILRADMKYGKKQFTVDETRRDSYGLFHPLSYGNESHFLSSSTGDVKRLVPVGLQEPLAYAKSLARFAANLGPLVWKIASKKVESILPTGLKYGPGCVGENGAPLNPSSFSSDKQKSSNSSAGDCNSRKLVTPSASDLSSAMASEEIVEAVRKLNSQNELHMGGHGDTSWRMQFQAQQKPLYQPHRNGFNGMFGYNLSTGGLPRNSEMEGISLPSQMAETTSRHDLLPIHSSSTNRAIPDEARYPESRSALPSEYPAALGKSSWQTLAMQQRHNLSVPPDLNVQVPTVSPSSSLQIGSPRQQPDLGLQL